VPTIKKPSKKQRVLDFAAARGWTAIAESEWNLLREALPDVSPSVIRQSGIPVAAPWSGVRQHAFDELEQSLRDFSSVYESRPDLRVLCRQQVIEAKDRAKWLACSPKSSEDVRDRKTGMAEWMLLWLSDPALFPSWVSALRLNTPRSC
jgi:hypothetical protein